MKTLPPIHGLLRIAAEKEAQASREADASLAEKKSFATAHASGVEADRLAKEAGEIRAYAGDTADIIVQVEAIITYINLGKLGSPSRTLALRDLESASMRLRREIGDNI